LTAKGPDPARHPDDPNGSRGTPPDREGSAGVAALAAVATNDRHAMPANPSTIPMKTPIPTVCRLALTLAATALITQCAHDPVTQANASQASAREISGDARAALQDLYAKEPAARRLGRSAAGVLIFPHITKGGLIVGAEAGNGVLLGRNSEARGYYQSAGASYGMQAGVQQYGYALFLMSAADVANLDRAAGWEVGSSPDFVVVDRGKSATLTSRTLDRGTYAYVFNQKGLMAGVSFKGTKITRIQPGN
jgi:lipid-binding SYLF domain-containing protein